MIWRNLSLQEFGRGAISTFVRFPLTLLSAFIGTAICFWLYDLEYYSRQENAYLWKLLVFSWLGLILFFDLELITERYGFRREKRWLIYGLGMLALAAYYIYLPEKLQGPQIDRYYIQLFLFALGLHLLASFAAYLNLKTENGFWQFNEKLFLRFLTATLYAAVLYIGLNIALIAIKQLFQVPMPDYVFLKLWFFMAGVFHPWFFLAGVPQDLQALETETKYPKGLKVFTQFVLLPLVTVYLLILYVYLGKIVVQWNWPRGWVSYLVLSFSIVGIFSLLLIYPLRNTEGNSWIRTYSKWFYRALFPLLILFALAIWRRVSDYGITEERYFVLALAFWLLVIAVYFLFSRKKNIKFIPVTLCFLAFLVSFGPWGAFAISRRSQTNRLEYFFEKNGMFLNGKLRPAPTEVTQKDASEIASIMHYLSDKHSLESIEPWFNPTLKKIYAQPYPEQTYHESARVNDLFVALDLQKYQFQNHDFTSQNPEPADVNNAQPQIRNFNFTSPASNFVKTTGYDYFFTVRLNSGSDRQYFYRFENGSLWIENQVKKGRYTQRLLFKWNEKDTSSLNLRPLMQDLIKKHNQQPENYNQQPTEKELTLFATVGKASLKLIFKSIDISETRGNPETSNFEVVVFVKIPAVSGSESVE